MFSGGKDRLSLADLLREHWPRMMFYYVDTVDLLPEKAVAGFIWTGIGV